MCQIQDFVSIPNRDYGSKLLEGRRREGSGGEEGRRGEERRGEERRDGSNHAELYLPASFPSHIP